jgi:hypothetical protein
MRIPGAVLIVPLLVAVAVSWVHAQPVRSPTSAQAVAGGSDAGRAPGAASPAVESRGSGAGPGSAKALRPAPVAGPGGEEIAERARKVLLLLLGTKRSSDAR